MNQQRKLSHLLYAIVNCFQLFHCSFSYDFDERRTNNYTIYGLALPDNDTNPQFKIITVFTNLLEPFPAEITQMESQFIRLKNSHYFYSPYPTETQKTSIKLSSSSVQSFTKLSPYSTKGSTLQFGPYESINAFAVSNSTY